MVKVEIPTAVHDGAQRLRLVQAIPVDTHLHIPGDSQSRKTAISYITLVLHGFEDLLASLIFLIENKPEKFGEYPVNKRRF